MLVHIWCVCISSLANYQKQQAKGILIDVNMAYGILQYWWHYLCYWPTKLHTSWAFCVVKWYRTHALPLRLKQCIKYAVQQQCPPPPVFPQVMTFNDNFSTNSTAQNMSTAKLDISVESTQVAVHVMIFPLLQTLTDLISKSLPIGKVRWIEGNVITHMGLRDELQVKCGILVESLS